jgi:hypothetical protein
MSFRVDEELLMSFDIFTAVITVFWDVTPCSFVDADLSEERAASICKVEELFI